MNKGAFDPRRRLATPLSKLVVLSLFIFGWLVSAAPAQDSQPSAVLFKDVRVFDGKSAGLSGPTNVLVRGNKIEKISTADPRRPNQQYPHYQWRRTHPDARVDRHALAHDVCAAVPFGSARVGPRLRQPGCGRRGYRHADARLHHGPRHGWAVVRAEACDRRWRGLRSADLPFR